MHNHQKLKHHNSDDCNSSGGFICWSKLFHSKEKSWFFSTEAFRWLHLNFLVLIYFKTYFLAQVKLFLKRYTLSMSLLNWPMAPSGAYSQIWLSLFSEINKWAESPWHSSGRPAGHLHFADEQTERPNALNGEALNSLLACFLLLTCGFLLTIHNKQMRTNTYILLLLLVGACPSATTLLVWFAAFASVEWYSVPTSWSLAHPCLSKAISLEDFVLLFSPLCCVLSLSLFFKVLFPFL